MKYILSLVLALNTPFWASAESNTTLPKRGNTSDTTIYDLQKKYPNAKIKQVTPEEYKTYQKIYAQNSKEIKSPASNPKKLTTSKPNKPYNPCLAPDYYSKASPKASMNITASPKEPNYDLGFKGGKSKGGYGSGDKDFLIIVAVIGVVIVAALVVYSVSYIYNMATMGFDCKAWDDFGYRYSYISDSSKTQTRDGNFSGLYYSSGYRIPIGIIGLTAELGYHDLDIEIKATSQKYNYSGAYLLLGPKFDIPFNQILGHSFQIELLGGTSTKKDLGFMSTLRMGLNFNLAPTFSMGVNFGAAILDIRGLDNYIDDRDDLNYLSGISVSYRW